MEKKEVSAYSQRALITMLNNVKETERKRKRRVRRITTTTTTTTGNYFFLYCRYCCFYQYCVFKWFVRCVFATLQRFVWVVISSSIFCSCFSFFFFIFISNFFLSLIFRLFNVALRDALAILCSVYTYLRSDFFVCQSAKVYFYLSTAALKCEIHIFVLAYTQTQMAVAC